MLLCQLDEIDILSDNYVVRIYDAMILYAILEILDFL